MKRPNERERSELRLHEGEGEREYNASVVMSEGKI